MAKINFGGVMEDMMMREEFPLEKARKVLKNEVYSDLVGRKRSFTGCDCRDYGSSNMSFFGKEARRVIKKNSQKNYRQDLKKLI